MFAYRRGVGSLGLASSCLFLHGSSSFTPFYCLPPLPPPLPTLAYCRGPHHWLGPGPCPQPHGLPAYPPHSQLCRFALHGSLLTNAFASIPPACFSCCVCRSHGCDCTKLPEAAPHHCVQPSAIHVAAMCGDMLCCPESLMNMWREKKNQNKELREKHRQEIA